MKKTRHFEIAGVVIFAITFTYFTLFFFAPNQTTEKTNPTTTSNQNSSSNRTVAQEEQVQSSNTTNTNQLLSPNHQNTVSTPQKIPKATNLNTGPSPTFETESGIIYPLRTYKTLEANDPYATQWWTTNTDLDAAWTIGAGSYQTTVAVIDTGFALQHEEFNNRWAINTSEKGPTTSENPSKLNCTDRSLELDGSCNLIDDDYDGIVDNEYGSTIYENISQLNCTDKTIPIDKSCNMIDDDDNGYIDDVNGWDFANYDSSPQAGETNPFGSGINHATKVSSVLGATGNNNLGIAGVNWSTKILPLQAIDDDSYGNSITVGNAIYYAVERGVDLINLSLGSDEEDDYTRQAVQYAIDNGVIVVAASGNSNCNCMIYPANYPEVIAVGSYNSSNVRSSFSSYGDNLDILAPGEGMRTASWSVSNQTSLYSNGSSGTSFASPYVSGLLALARSHQTNVNWSELTNALLSSANHTGLTNAIPWSSQIGSGYVRANNLLSRVTTPTTSDIRYNFTPIVTTGTLSTTNIYQCSSSGDFPTAPLYEIKVGSSYYYTIDALDYTRKLGSGYITRNLGRTCVGLYGDNPARVRTINLLKEILNISSKSEWL